MDKYVIIKDTSGHGWPIGAEVTLVRSGDTGEGAGLWGVFHRQRGFGTESQSIYLTDVEVSNHVPVWDRPEHVVLVAFGVNAYTRVEAYAGLTEQLHTVLQSRYKHSPVAEFWIAEDDRPADHDQHNSSAVFVPVGTQADHMGMVEPKRIVLMCDDNGQTVPIECPSLTEAMNLGAAIRGHDGLSAYLVTGQTPVPVDVALRVLADDSIADKMTTLWSDDQAAPEHRVSGEGVEVIVTRSAGKDNAVLVIIDTESEPDGSDGGPGLRVMVNDGAVFEGVPLE